MPLRHSPKLTPRALAARRANALKSTGPRTERGKAWSCLNALRHGRRARRDLRARIARTGDSEALFLLDWFHECILRQWQPQTERHWGYTVRLAARVWCFMTGRSLRPRNPTGKWEVRLKLEGAMKSYTYADSWRVPYRLQIASKKHWGIRFVNPTPTRRKHVCLGWLPQVEYLPGDPPKPKRVRRVRDEQGFPAGLGLPVNGLAFSRPRLLTSSLAAGIEPWMALEMAQKEVLAELERYDKSMVCNDIAEAAELPRAGHTPSAGTPASARPEGGQPGGQPCRRPYFDGNFDDGGEADLASVIIFAGH